MSRLMTWAIALNLFTGAAMFAADNCCDDPDCCASGSCDQPCCKK